MFPIVHDAKENFIPGYNYAVLSWFPLTLNDLYQYFNRQRRRMDLTVVTLIHQCLL